MNCDYQVIIYIASNPLFHVHEKILKFEYHFIWGIDLKKKIVASHTSLLELQGSSRADSLSSLAIYEIYWEPKNCRTIT